MDLANDPVVKQNLAMLSVFSKHLTKVKHAYFMANELLYVCCDLFSKVNSAQPCAAHAVIMEAMTEIMLKASVAEKVD